MFLEAPGCVVETPMFDQEGHSPTLLVDPPMSPLLTNGIISRCCFGDLCEFLGTAILQTFETICAHGSSALLALWH